MGSTTPTTSNRQDNNADFVKEALDAWDEWESQEAINRAAIAKEHGFKPWKGFASAGPSKTSSLSNAEQEKAKAQQAKALQAWLNEGKPETVAAQHQLEEDGPAAQPEAAQAAPMPVVKAIETAVKQQRPRKATPARKLPHGRLHRGLDSKGSL